MWRGLCSFWNNQLLILRIVMKNKILLAVALFSSSSVVMAGAPVQVPEPSMLPLLAIGAIALIINKLRKK